jgi:serine/threonine protein kinase
LQKPVDSVFPFLDQALSSELSPTKAQRYASCIREHFSSWVELAEKRPRYHVYEARKNETGLHFPIRIYLSNKDTPKIQLVLGEVGSGPRKFVEKVLVITPTNFSTLAEVGINKYIHDHHLRRREMYRQQKELNREMSLVKKLSEKIPTLPKYTQVNVPDTKGHIRAKYQTKLAEGNLQELCCRHGPVPFKGALEIITQLATTLQGLHENGWCYEDLKSENVLIFKGERAQLCDFEFVTRSGKRQKMQGTPAYIAPEMFSHEEFDAHPSMDMWSLGSLIYHLVVLDKDPFVGTQEEGLDNTFSNPETRLFYAKKIEADNEEARKDLLGKEGDAEHTAFYKLAAQLLSQVAQQRPTAEDVLRGVKEMQASLAKSESSAAFM